MVLVTGHDTPLGKALTRELEASGFTTVSLASADCQLPADRLARLLDDLPTVHFIVHAYELDDLQLAERFPDLAYQFNVLVSRLIGEFAARRGIPLVLLSSFLVFDGSKRNPYIAVNPPRALSAYGRTKAEAEAVVLDIWSRCLVLRTGWLLHAEAGGWLDQQLDLALRRRMLLVSDVHTFNPTSVSALARVVRAILEQLRCNINVWGIYHYACGEPVTHRELINALTGLLQGYLPDYKPSYAVCGEDQSPLVGVELPRNGVLGCVKLRNTFGIRQKAWRIDLPGLVHQRLERLRSDQPAATVLHMPSMAGKQ